MPKNKLSQMRFSKFIVISIVLLLCYPTFMASAASTENISIGSSVANPGEVIELPITIENATDVEKLTLNITYDKDILNVTSIKANESIQNSTIIHSVDNNNGIATIELTNPNITAVSTIPLIDVTFQAESGGISTLSLQDVMLTKNSVQYPPGYVNNGEIYVNSPPELEPIDDILIDESDTVTITLNASDPDNNNLTYSKDVDFGTLNKNVFTWTPSFEDSGLHYIEFNASDGSLSDIEKVLIAVGDTNRPPVLEEIGLKNVDENSTLAFKLNASDYDGDPITYSAEGLPSGASLDNSTGQFTWTPTYEQAGTYFVDFITNDYHSYKDVERVKIEVNNVNRAPFLQNIPKYTINETETVTIILNASDPDNNPLTYSKNVTTIGHLNNNEFTWTPGYYDNGTHYIEFTVNDSSLSDSKIAIISVSNSNMPPEILPIKKQYIYENDELELTIEADDGDGDTLSYYAANLPEGSKLNGSTGIFTWKPEYDQEGTYSFEINVTDGNHDISEMATIIVRDKEPSESEKFKNTNSGSGGGGGSQSTGEKYENIEVKDYALKSVAREVKTSYEFKDEANSINYINFTALKNAGQVKAIIEVLKNQSSLVETSPSGVVYQHMNIWVGDSKFTTAGFIAYADIIFEVDRSWIEDNEIAESSIRLCRHSKNGWTELPTKKIGEDEDKIYFKAKTPGFSPFAINGDKISDVIAENEKALYSTQSTSSQITMENDQEAEIQTDVVSDTEEYSEEAANQSEKKSSASLFILFIGIIGIAGAGGYVMKNEDKKAIILEMKMKYMEKWMKNREP